MHPVPDKRIRCPYCKGWAALCDSAVIYRRSYGLVFLCRPCDARVGVHKGTTEPLGTLADYQTREARKRAHAAFDPLWGPDRYRLRSPAYAWLAEQMDLLIDDTHIGLFTAEQADRVVEILKIKSPDQIRAEFDLSLSGHRQPATNRIANATAQFDRPLRWDSLASVVDQHVNGEPMTPADDGTARLAAALGIFDSAAYRDQVNEGGE